MKYLYSVSENLGLTSQAFLKSGTVLARTQRQARAGNFSIPE
ncbi:hypothetical protein [Tatumella sp. UCD-D_suzukii]|nr:hypothetical protein [Tatumella sp. UCD-D_suzukii]